MHSVLVANPKGGSGKTTVATNLAGAVAHRGAQVLLWDLDRQQSSLTWLSIRPAELPSIGRLDRHQEAGRGTAPKDGWLVIDSPAGAHGKALSQMLKLVTRVIVPIQPSVFDLAAAGAFLDVLQQEKALRKGRAFVGIVGVRVDPRTRAAATLEGFLSQFDVPVLGYLRDSQVYPNAAFTGRTIFDLPRYLAGRDVEQWAPLLAWLEDSSL